MGFDVVGVKPINEKGKYFRNNCWYWRPLWNYVDNLDILTEKDISMGYYNDGYLISKSKALRLSKKLKDELLKGNTKKYEKEYREYLAHLPDVQCDICKGTGVRNDEIVQGECNGCKGKGTRRPFDTYYPFEEENVKEFAEFVEASGGFRIH